MATNVNDAFDQLVGRLTPSNTEATAAASHRASIEQCLKAQFGMFRFFRSGSFGFGTSVSGYSDVDYFAVLPTNRLKQDSNSTLNEVAAALRVRFPLTGVKIEAPVVVVPFGSNKGERHEIIPADFLWPSGGADVFHIPNRAGGWIQSSPDAHGRRIDNVNDRLGKKVKPLIRLMKAWKYYNAVPIRSFYLEMRTAEYAATQSTIIHRWDVRGVLQHLLSVGLADMTDPTGLPDPIYAAYTSEIPTILAKIRDTLTHADAAFTLEEAGNVRGAFARWDNVFNYGFPGYY